METQYALRFGIVTPTYSRDRLLKRFFKQVRKQDYDNWRLVFVHDGPSIETGALVASLTQIDPRVSYVELADRSNDFGTTPRLMGARHLLQQESVDYLVFWDDDNLFYQDVLSNLNTALLERDRPSLLMPPFQHEQKTLPPTDIPLNQLHAGHVDSANVVVRADVGVDCLSRVREEVHRELKKAYISDYLFFDELRRFLPPSEIHIVHQNRAIGVHDGLRLLQRIRWSLGIPNLQLASFPFYRNLKKRLYDWI